MISRQKADSLLFTCLDAAYVLEVQLQTADSLIKMQQERIFNLETQRDVLSYEVVRKRRMTEELFVDLEAERKKRRRGGTFWKVATGVALVVGVAIGSR